MRQSSETVRQSLANELGRRMFGLANMQADGRQGRAGRDPLEQLVEFLEGVRLQMIEIWIHFLPGGQAAGRTPPFSQGCMI